MCRTDSFEETLTLGKIEGWKRKGTTEDEMVEWHHKKKNLIQISEVAVSDCTILHVLFNHSEVQTLHLLNKDVNAKLIQ